MTERQRWEARADVGMRTQKYGFFAENYLARVTDNKFCVDPELLIRKYSQYLLPEDNGTEKRQRKRVVCSSRTRASTIDHLPPYYPRRALSEENKTPEEGPCAAQTSRASSLEELVQDVAGPRHGHELLEVARVVHRALGLVVRGPREA